MQVRKLVLIRHGELPDEYAHKFIGRKDIPLSEKGRAQCHALRPFFETYHVETLYSSPLRRAQESAALVAPGITPLVDNRLAEIDFGECELMDYDGLSEKFPEIARFWGDRNRINRVTFPGGESAADVAERAKSFLDSLPDSGEGTIGIVTHGGILVNLIAALLENSLETQWNWLPDRGSISVFKIHDGKHPAIAELFNFCPENFPCLKSFL